MNRRTLILAVTTAAAVAVGGLTTITRSHAQTSPSTSPATATATTAVSPTTSSSSGSRLGSDSSSRFGDRRSDDRGSSRRYGNGNGNGGASNYPVPKLTGTQYAALESRSIFAKGRYLNRDGEPGDRTTTTRPSEPYTPPAPERTLVFEGATEFDYDYVAFIEDQSSMKVLMLKSGDAVGRGRVGQITLNYMDYVDKAGKTVRVSIGKNLEGSDPPATQPTYTSSYSSPYSSSPSSYSSTPSSSSGTPYSASPSSSGGILSPADAAAERLRRRRAAELGGGGG